MTAIRRRLLGLALLAVAAVAFASAAAVAPVIVPNAGAASGDPDLVVPSPVSLLAAPALLAAGSVLVVSGAAALLDADLSARVALLAPAIGGGVAFALVAGVVTAPAAILPALAEADALATLVSGPPGTIATGVVAGGAVAPVIRATTTEDTAALLAGAVLLLAATAVGGSDPVSLVAGGVGGAIAVGLLWAVDPKRWRP